jgi:hypothetical protein
MKLLLLFAGIFAVLPHVVFRGKTLRRYFACDAALWAIAIAIYALPILPPFDPHLAIVFFGVVKLALFAIFLARGAEVKWSAARAAIVAALVYALVIPAMLQYPIDGDEPYYLLMTESLVRDHDLDLANQYRDLEHSATGRPDLQPQQLVDRTGLHGEKYSHLEPFLAFLLIPGYLLGGLAGALATVALFGALLARAVVRMLEDEGFDEATVRAVFPFVALAPPVLFYATRIWPEVPAAWAFVEAVRGVRQQRPQRWIPMLFAMALLKLRFLLIAIPLALLGIRRRPKLAILLLIFAIPVAIAWMTTIHGVGEVVPGTLRNFVIGLFGMIVDGAGGIAFQAPFYLLGIFAIARWRAMPESFRIGVMASLVYLIYLLPRPEWHGGWSPPLRYIVVLLPILAAGAAAMLGRARGWIAPIAIWTAGLLVHGIRYPFRLFHLENGENAVGEFLSTMYHSDFSRLFPSMIRVNTAAIVASVLFVVALAVGVRTSSSARLLAPFLALLLACGYVAGRTPGTRVEFEDAHVTHDGGELYPWEWTPARFAYRCGWIVRPGTSLGFLARGGIWRLQYTSPSGATIDLAGQQYQLAPTGLGDYAAALVSVPRDGRVVLRCRNGSAILDRMDHD